MLRLEGILAKVSRAKAQTEFLKGEAKRFFEQYPPRVVVAELNPKTGNHVLRFLVPSGGRSFPPYWSVIIGEVAHDLRSALDLLVCQLAISKNCFASCEDTSFPIRLYGPRSVSKARRRKRWTDRSPAIRPLTLKHRRLIKSAQPYYRRNGQRLSPLWLLQELNISDKHRLLQIMIARPDMWNIMAEASDGVGDVSSILKRVDIKFPKRLIHGTKVGEVALITKAEGNWYIDVAPQMSFWEECKAVKFLPVVLTLQRMADEVSRVIELFRTDP